MGEFGISIPQVSAPILFAGATNGNSGLWKSIDEGRSWIEPSNNLLQDTSIRSILAFGADIYVGEYAGGVQRSIDNAENWTIPNSPLKIYHVVSLARIGSRIFAATWGTGSGVQLSIDNGISWNAVNTGLPDLDGLNKIFAVGNTLFLGTNNGIYISTDFGTNWTLASGSTGNIVLCFGISGSSMFAGIQPGILKSTDGGLNWTQILGSGTFYDFVVVGVNIFGASTNGVYLSTNDGETWTQKIQGMTGGYNIRAIISSGANLIAGAWGGAGIYYSTDNGENWIASSFAGGYSPWLYSLLAK
jgi:photosystem II stability/assembly factor-like uncharacterized protein